MRRAHPAVLTLQIQDGPPPQVLWITLGNTANANTKEVFKNILRQAIAPFTGSEALVEVEGLESI
jgi:predicted nuclease of predicted toxin-antitoxin system